MKQPYTLSPGSRSDVGVCVCVQLSNITSDIEPTTNIFFFDSYGLEGLKHIIIQDDKEIVDKILIGIDKMDRSDNKITLCKIKLDLAACKQLSEDEIISLSDTARNFFLFHSNFWK